MAAFTAGGREWSVRLTVGLLGDVRRDAGVELGKVLTDPERLTQIVFGDPETFARVLWVLVQDQAAAAGVEPEAFARHLDREAIDGATLAVLDAVADFTRPPETATRTKAALRGVMKAMDRAGAAEMGRIETTAETLTAEELAELARKRPLPTSNGTGGSSAASSDSTPGPSASAS